MSRAIIKHSYLFFIWLTPYICSANSYWNGKTAQMQCGPALVQVTAECQVDQLFPTDNICRNYKLEIKTSKGSKVFNLPYMPTNQKKLLEKQGYTFNNIVKPGDWAPFMMKCYDNDNIVIGYQLGLSEEESVSGSLLPYVDAPFFNRLGVFVTGGKLSSLRSREIKNPYDYTNIDFISNR